MQQPDDQIAPRIIAIANQKGGVGKTTTAVNLGAAFAAAGLSVLIIDLDPQGNASTALGIAMEDRVRSMTEVILGECSLQDAIRPTEMKGLRIVPATTDLASMGLHLAQQRGRLRIVRNAIRTEGPQNEARADVILIDCPPSVHLLTLTALAPAEISPLKPIPVTSPVDAVVKLRSWARSSRLRIAVALHISGSIGGLSMRTEPASDVVGGHRTEWVRCDAGTSVDSGRQAGVAAVRGQ